MWREVSTGHVILSASMVVDHCLLKKMVWRATAAVPRMPKKERGRAHQGSGEGWQPLAPSQPSPSLQRLILPRETIASPVPFLLTERKRLEAKQREDAWEGRE